MFRRNKIVSVFNLWLSSEGKIALACHGYCTGILHGGLVTGISVLPRVYCISISRYLAITESWSKSEISGVYPP